ncbi:MAG TPA: hypothetical protein P5137_12335, partial [Candidatus Brocadiia bacterium]|nr:hypothetical protein [Candidatus Brocadiia bacterium]
MKTDRTEYPGQPQGCVKRFSAALAAAVVAAWLSSQAAAQIKVLPPPEDNGAGLLFHASFDKDRR